MMNQETYNKITTIVQEHSGLTMHCLKLLKQKFPLIKEGTLSSIISLHYQRLMKQNYNKSDSTIDEYYQMYTKMKNSDASPGIIIRMSNDINIAPCLLARLILTKYLSDGNNTEANISILVNKQFRDTTLIKDKHLAYEVYLCNLYDDQYSSMVEIMKSSLGQEYEIKLYREIARLNVAYRDEEYLRKLGYDKTPDVKLDIPIAVDGFIIHWIESKALFGDYEAHQDYLKNQYSSYWNRFGSGLVIYWFGYVENIVSPCDKRFIIRDHLPKNIVTI